MLTPLYCHTWDSHLLVLTQPPFSTLDTLKSHLSKHLNLPNATYIRLVQANKTLLDIAHLRYDYTLHVTLASGL